jgi:hypothetical protein
VQSSTRAREAAAVRIDDTRGATMSSVPRKSTLPIDQTSSFPVIKARTSGALQLAAVKNWHRPERKSRSRRPIGMAAGIRRNS